MPIVFPLLSYSFRLFERLLTKPRVLRAMIRISFRLEDRFLSHLLFPNIDAGLLPYRASDWSLSNLLVGVLPV